MIQPGSEPAQIEMMGNALHYNVTSSSTHWQLDQVGVRLIDVGINISEIEIRSQRDEAEIVKLDYDNVWISCPRVKVMPLTDANEQVHVPHINLLTSGYVPESTRGSCMSTYDTGTWETIPQLNGPISIPSRLRRRRSSECAGIEADSDPRTTTLHRREYPGDDSDDSHNDRKSYRDHRPPERGRSQGHNGRPTERGCHQSRGYFGRDFTGWNGGPSDDGGLPDDGEPPNNGRPPGGGWHLRRPGGQGPPGPKGPPGPVRPVIVQMPQITLDTTALENTFDTVGQSMLQLARAQDQTNRQLQQHLQQGQLNMQAHTGALQQLATSTYQCNFDHILASIPIYDGSDREGFFPWLECLEVACFYSGRNIKTEALGRSAGPDKNVIMALLNGRSWKAIGRN